MTKSFGHANVSASTLWSRDERATSEWKTNQQNTTAAEEKPPVDDWRNPLDFIPLLTTTGNRYTKPAKINATLMYRSTRWSKARKNDERVKTNQQTR